MVRTLKYRCPVCKKPLTKKEFERALKIHEARQEHIEARERQLQEKERQFKAKEKRIKKEAQEEARESERQHTRRIVQGKDIQIGKLRNTIKLLRRSLVCIKRDTPFRSQLKQTRLFNLFTFESSAMGR